MRLSELSSEHIARVDRYKGIVSANPKLRTVLAPRLNKYIKHKPHPKQGAFLSLNQFIEGFYGGAASGGKSDALLAAGLQYVDVPGYAALLLRRTFRDLSLPSALLPRAKEWLHNTDAQFSPSKYSYTFPSGATLTFGYLAREDDVFQYDSAEFQYIGFDELTQFSETQYRFMFGRLRKRKSMPVPLRIRGASNPGGIGHQWVKDRLVKGWDLKKGRFFIPALREDNPSVDQESYDRSLENLPPLMRLQRKYGDWDAQYEGNMFKREWFKLRSAVPAEARRIRFWDLAATEGSGDYTVGTKLSVTEDGLYCVEDVVRGQWGPMKVEKLIRQVAGIDGPEVEIQLEQEPGASGKIVAANYILKLAGFSATAKTSTGKKEVRWRPLAAQAEAGNVVLLSAPWNNEWIEEICAVPNCKHDDQVDSVSGAFNHLALHEGEFVGVSFLS